MIFSLSLSSSFSCFFFSFFCILLSFLCCFVSRTQRCTWSFHSFYPLLTFFFFSSDFPEAGASLEPAASCPYHRPRCVHQTVRRQARSRNQDEFCLHHGAQGKLVQLCSFPRYSPHIFQFVLQLIPASQNEFDENFSPRDREYFVCTHVLCKTVTSFQHFFVA